MKKPQLKAALKAARDVGGFVLATWLLSCLPIKVFAVLSTLAVIGMLLFVAYKYYEEKPKR